MHGTTGNIFLRRKVDREVDQRFTLTIIAKDSGVPSLSSAVKVNIQIEDVNDNPPVFSPLFYNTEASSINLCDPVITTVRATDADIGRNAAINYYINENDDKAPFTVSNFGNCLTRLMIFKNKVKDHLAFAKESLSIVIFI